MGRREVKIQVQGTKNRGKLKQNWTDSVRADYREKCLSGEEVGDLHRSEKKTE